MTEQTMNDAHSGVALGEQLFKWRDYTPIPLILLLLIFGDPSTFSVTIGMISIIVGEFIRIYSVAFIGGVSRTRTSSTNQALVTEGPYSLVRNPLYVGNFFIVLGICLYGNETWLIVLATLAFAFQYWFIVKYEENLLGRKFPDTFGDYKKKVPAWIPKSLPRLSILDNDVNLARALASEKRTLSAIVGILALLSLFS